MNQDNFYNILGVNENATQEEIKKTYRKLARESLSGSKKQILILDKETFPNFFIENSAVNKYSP